MIVSLKYTIRKKCHVHNNFSFQQNFPFFFNFKIFRNCFLRIQKIVIFAEFLVIKNNYAKNMIKMGIASISRIWSNWSTFWIQNVLVENLKFGLKVEMLIKFSRTLRKIEILEKSEICDLILVENLHKASKFCVQVEILTYLK